VLDKWVPYRSESATVQLRVIGFPHAAGNALFYRSWRKHMPHDIDFCPVELPGHGQRMDEMPFTNWERLAAALQVVLEPLLTVPFAFFGHSTGACIAFEAARVLRAADGRAAMHLFVSGRPAPGLVVGDHPVHSLSDQDLVAALIRYGSTPAVVMDRGELMAAILPALRADLALAESVRPAAGARLPCPITVFGGADDAIDDVSLQGWSDLTAATFRVRMFPGGHFYLGEASDALVDEIVKEVRRSQTSLAPRLAGAAI
jgi:medium-chain acyl-[acyl-carrier-protein] hydrolase